MSETDSSPAKGSQLTVAIDLPSARLLADQIATTQDLQFVMECCKRLLTELSRPEEEQEPVVPQALWSAALVAYDRCFANGKRYGLTVDDVRALPLQGEVVKFHEWVLTERKRTGTHPTDPYDVATAGAVLSAPDRPKRRVQGVAVLSSNRILVDGNGVRQLGALASELARQLAEKAQKQQEAVLAEAEKLDLDKLYEQPPLRTEPPDGAGD